MSEQVKQQPQGGLLANLGFNIIIPTVILIKLSGENYLGPTYSIILALAFPVVYGLKDYIRTRKTNFFSILGVVSVLLTGGISLLHLDPQYIAIKEAAIPGLLGVATLVSVYTRFPLVKTFLYNPRIMQVDKVAEALRENGNEQEFERRLRIASYLVASSFFLSSVLNYILARIVVVSPPGTVAFSEELGRLTALSFPVIAVPSMLVLFVALFYLLSSIHKLTGLKLEDVFLEHDKAS